MKHIGFKHQWESKQNSDNKEFFKLFNSIFNKIGYACFIIIQYYYLNIKILKFDENFEILETFRKFYHFEIF
jgi:hypothetical protein